MGKSQLKRRFARPVFRMQFTYVLHRDWIPGRAGIPHRTDPSIRDHQVVGVVVEKAQQREQDVKVEVLLILGRQTIHRG